MFENSEHTTNSLQRAIESLDGIEKHCEKLIRRHQNDARNTLEISQSKTAESLKQSLGKYYTFSLDSQHKILTMVDKLQRIASTSVDPSIQVIVQELQCTLKSIRTKSCELMALEDVEAKKLRDLQRSDAVELEFLQETETQNRIVLQKHDTDQLRMIQECFRDPKFTVYSLHE